MPAKKAKPGLPRIDWDAPAPAVKQEEIVLPMSGATVVIRSLSGSDYDEIPWLSDNPSDIERTTYEAAYIAAALVEPKANVRQLRNWRKDHPIADWMTLYQACLRLAAPGEEELRAAQQAFPEQSG